MAHSMVGNLLVMAGLALAAPSPVAADSGSLHLVRRIHVGTLTDYPERSALVQAALEMELRTAGFEVVDDRAAPDAVLSATATVTITVDGDERTNPRDAYSFLLTLAPTGKLVWTTKVYISNGQAVQGESREVGTVAVRRLAAAWKKSARKAAHGR